jgi:hypothetical protein
VVTIEENNILLAHSPIYIKYTNDPTLFTFIKVKLWVWKGLISSKPNLPTFELVGYKNRSTNDTISIEVSDYINPFLDPKPTKGYFNGDFGDFGEFVNVQYMIVAYYFEFGLTDFYEAINSPVLFATLGHVKYNQLLYPHIKINNGKLIDNTKRFSTPNLVVYDALLNSSTNSSEGVINRVYTANYKPVCDRYYIPRQIMFLNKNGLLDTFVFPRVSSQKMKSTSEKYKATDNSNVTYNKNGNVEWTFNTDNLDDYNVDVIEELYASDRHWLIDYRMKTFIPIQLSDDNFERKTSVKDRAKMNYTIRFIESNDYIQNIR